MKLAPIVFLLGATLAGTDVQTREIDPIHSIAHFTVAHIWVEKVDGTIPIVSGSLVLEPGSLIPVNVQAVLDASKVATGVPDRDRSLASPDFFDAAKFPLWTFVSTKIVPRGQNAFQMDGDLTIHGVTQPEHLNVAVSGSIEHPRYRATATIDRHAFGMAVTRLDPTIGATADVTLVVTLK